MNSTAGSASRFETQSSWYDSRYDRPGADRHALRARLEAVLELLGPGPGQVLDAGMGPGRLAAELAGRGWEVSGLDVAEEMVALARQRLPEAAERLVRGDLQELPFPDESFNAVVATGVLEYAGVEPALSELARVLRPGGRAVVSYPNPGSAYGMWKTRVYYRCVRVLKRAARMPPPRLPRGAGPVDAGSFRARLGEAGLQTTETRFTSFLLVPSPLDDLLPALAERIGQRLEGSGAGWARRVATQVVYAATKKARV